VKPSRRKPAPWKPVFRRYIFNTLTVVSLLLMLATVGLWQDSHWAAIGVSYTTETKNAYSIINHSNGSVTLQHLEYELTMTSVSTRTCNSATDSRAPEPVFRSSPVI